MAPSTFRRAGKNPTPRKPFSQKNSRPNASILSFFKKVEVEKTLFCGGDVPSNEVVEETGKIYEPEDHHALITEQDFPDKSPKRRKLSRDDTRDSPIDSGLSVADSTEPGLGTRSSQSTSVRASGKTIGGFVVDDSDSEDGDEEGSSPAPITSSEKVEGLAECPKAPGYNLEDETRVNPSNPLPRGPIPDLVDECGLEYLEGNSEDHVGEEYREMLFSQEQARLEAEEAGQLIEDDFAPRMLPDDSIFESCPVCNGSLVGATPYESTRHVNSCLDGNPTPLPSKKPAVPEPEPTPLRPEAVKAHPIAEKAAIPRPGQRNPIALALETESSSAFSKLMCGNAENAAWSEAAAAETASRGKPAYKRTCPFYKIMPGFSICVDAFRYGAVKDCNAYFLSHFHSDHYIGLTSSWKHGPIYCSRVTGRLVKQQLRVDAKWVVELEFEEQFDIPGTDGAVVTMIPANHCPGSSMFLFEKKMGRGLNPRLQRILHCGDFRACPGHVTHERLKPDVLDKVSGKLRQQKIDICYLDTTYLSPRYSFPPQRDVITACAELCAELDSDPETADAAWEKVGKQTGNASVSKFFGSKTLADCKTPDQKGRKDRLLVVCGTYSIGKERICIAIAKALNSKIFASAAKTRIFQQLDDPELAALLTTDPLEAQVHMQSLMEIRAETLQDYLAGYRPHFTRVVGFRPSGWNYRPAGASKMISAGTQPGAVPTAQVLHSKAWRTRFGKGDLQRQRGSTKEAMCFGVPYSEHSSFRELALFLMSLRIERVVPTVNVGSEASRKKMKGWIDKWLADRTKGGVLKVRVDDDSSDESTIQEWDGKGKKREVLW